MREITNLFILKVSPTAIDYILMNPRWRQIQSARNVEIQWSSYFLVGFHYVKYLETRQIPDEAD